MQIKVYNRNSVTPRAPFVSVKAVVFSAFESMGGERRAAVSCSAVAFKRGGIPHKLGGRLSHKHKFGKEILSNKLENEDTVSKVP